MKCFEIDGCAALQHSLQTPRRNEGDHFPDHEWVLVDDHLYRTQHEESFADARRGKNQKDMSHGMTSAYWIEILGNENDVSDVQIAFNKLLQARLSKGSIAKEDQAKKICARKIKQLTYLSKLQKQINKKKERTETDESLKAEDGQEADESRESMDLEKPKIRSKGKRRREKDESRETQIEDIRKEDLSSDVSREEISKEVKWKKHLHRVKKAAKLRINEREFSAEVAFAAAVTRQMELEARSDGEELEEPEVEYTPGNLKNLQRANKVGINEKRERVFRKKKGKRKAALWKKKVELEDTYISGVDNEDCDVMLTSAEVDLIATHPVLRALEAAKREGSTKRRKNVHWSAICNEAGWM